MRFVKRGGKILRNAGKIVTDNSCCCDTCLEDCVDETISVTLPAFTTSAGCDNCETGIPAGPHTLTAYTPGSPTAGCCYWRNLAPDPAGSGECELSAIYAEMCIVDETVTLTVTVERAGPVTVHTFSHEFAKCDFCAAMPGFVSLEGTGGDCDTEGVADVTFASSCCHPPDCNCDCFHDVGPLYFDWITEPPDFDPDGVPEPTGCYLFQCRESFGEDFPEPPYELTFVGGGESAAYYAFEYNHPEGGNFYIGLSCDWAPDFPGQCNCDTFHWENCEYVLSIGCSNLCTLYSRKCDKTLPSPDLPFMFSSDDDCYSADSPCGTDQCSPWEAIIYD